MKLHNILFISLSLLATIILFFPMVILVFSTSPAEYIHALMSHEVISAISLSLLSATITMLIAYILGVPLAYILARYEFRGRKIIEELLDLPIMLPHTVAGIAILMFLGPRTLVGSSLSNLGISFVDSMWGIIVAQFFVSSPLLIKPAIVAFRGIDCQLVSVARSLGAGSFRVFVDIEFPLAFRGINTGAVLCWMRAISEFGAVVILAYYPMTAPVLIYYKFTTSGLSATKPIASLLLLLSLGIFATIKYISGGT